MDDDASSDDKRAVTAESQVSGVCDRIITGFELPDTSSYTGEYVRYENTIIREGNGVYTYADKSTYSGQWQRDRQHGEGASLYADGGSFLGR
jgi:hypothetical protein